jgi:hypothetical protein
MSATAAIADNPAATAQSAPAAATVTHAMAATSAQAATTAAQPAAAISAASAATTETATPASAATSAPMATTSTPVETGSGPAMPTRGMSMENVEHIFGAPQEKLPAVPDPGTKLHPPITRWIYPNYVVYFEYNYVIHTVLKDHPFNNDASKN